MSCTQRRVKAKNMNSLKVFYHLNIEFGQTEVYHFGKLKCPREYDNTYFSKNKSPLTESEVEPV